ncbi:MAG: AMIN domain-containing protein [Ruminiclostridium sp.]|nr:AMIN domain-containing protein [Ruminiclostridium sp.]
MKKIPAIILSVFILALTTSNSFGQTIGFLKNIKYDQNGSQDIVSIYSTYIRDFKFFRLENPERIVVDIPNNLLAVKGSQTIDIGSSMINSIRFSQFTESISRVVIDVNGKPQYKVDTNSGCLTFIFGEHTATGLKTEDKSTGVS